MTEEEEEERPRSEDGGFTSELEDGVPIRRRSRRVWPDLALHQQGCQAQRGVRRISHQGLRIAGAWAESSQRSNGKSQRAEPRRGAQVECQRRERGRVKRTHGRGGRWFAASGSRLMGAAGEGG